jgi:hypothetical protein
LFLPLDLLELLFQRRVDDHLAFPQFQSLDMLDQEPNDPEDPPQPSVIHIHSSIHLVLPFLHYAFTDVKRVFEIVQQHVHLARKAFSLATPTRAVSRLSKTTRSASVSGVRLELPETSLEDSPANPFHASDSPVFRQGRPHGQLAFFLGLAR